MDMANDPFAGTHCGRRGRSRLRVRLPARIVTLTTTRSAILTDLSLTGACLQSNFEPPVGAEAMLQWYAFEGFGTVVWTDGNYAGVKFCELIAPDVLIRTRDLHDAERLASDREIAREVAGEWVKGVRRL